MHAASLNLAPSVFSSSYTASSDDFDVPEVSSHSVNTQPTWSSQTHPPTLSYVQQSLPAYNPSSSTSTSSCYSSPANQPSVFQMPPTVMQSVIPPTQPVAATIPSYGYNVPPATVPSYGAPINTYSQPTQYSSNSYVAPSSYNNTTTASSSSSGRYKPSTQYSAPNASGANNPYNYTSSSDPYRPPAAYVPLQEPSRAPAFQPVDTVNTVADLANVEPRCVCLCVCIFCVCILCVCVRVCIYAYFNA